MGPDVLEDIEKPDADEDIQGREGSKPDAFLSLGKINAIHAAEKDNARKVVFPGIGILGRIDPPSIEHHVPTIRHTRLKRRHSPLLPSANKKLLPIKLHASV